MTWLTKHTTTLFHETFEFFAKLCNAEEFFVPITNLLCVGSGFCEIIIQTLLVNDYDYKLRSKMFVEGNSIWNWCLIIVILPIWFTCQKIVSLHITRWLWNKMKKYNVIELHSVKVAWSPWQMCHCWTVVKCNRQKIKM